MTAGTALAAALAGWRPEEIVIAVSGGGDSLALMHLAADWAAGAPLLAVTVDHGLRRESAAEARQVAGAAAARGIRHETLCWRGWDGRGNLQAAAREARHALIADRARAEGRRAVLLGHTRDDQAETVLMALARAAGPDGLSAMAAARQARGVHWLRPLLGVGRDELRAELRRRGTGWAEDPTNDDPRFERVRVRRALAALAPLGLDAPALAAVAGRMQQVRAALDDGALVLARRAARIDGADVVLDDAALAAAPAELVRRLLADAVWFVSGATQPPRGRALAAARAALDASGRATVAGCLLAREDGRLRVMREYAAVTPLRCAAHEPWDGRWRLDGPPPPAGAHLAALGEAGLGACPPAMPRPARPRESLIAEPALWQGPRLLAPLLWDSARWHATRLPGPGHLIARIGAH